MNITGGFHAMNGSHGDASGSFDRTTSSFSYSKDFDTGNYSWRGYNYYFVLDASKAWTGESI